MSLGHFSPQLGVLEATDNLLEFITTPQNL